MGNTAPIFYYTDLIDNMQAYHEVSCIFCLHVRTTEESNVVHECRSKYLKYKLSHQSEQCDYVRI